MSVGGGKGGGGSPSQVVQTDLPEYAKPYFIDIMNRATTESKRGYQPYRSERIAGTNRDIDVSRAMVRDVAAAGTPQTDYAMGYTRNLMGDAAALGRQDPYQFSASSFGQTGVSPYYGFQGANVIPYAGFQAAQFGDQSGLFRAGQGQAYGGFTAGELSDVERGTAAGLESYMDPYNQLVTEQLKKKATEDFERTRAGRAAQAVSSGAFGGSRAAVEEGIASGDFLDRLAQIEAEQGSRAFQEARAAFEADRAARTDIEKARLAEKARVEQAQAAELARVQGIDIEEASRVQQAVAQERARIQNADASEFARIQQAQAAELARVQGISVEEAARIQAAEAAELARVQGITVEEAARVQAANAAERARIQEAQATENLRQREFQRSMMEFGANQAQQLANLEGAARSGDIQAAQLLEGIGAAQRADRQAQLDLAYQDFLEQRGYGQQQLNFLNSIMRGVPVSPSTQTFTPYNPIQQALGAGISGLALYRGLQS